MTATCQSFSILQSRKFLLPTTKGGAADVDNVEVNETKQSAMSRLAKLCPSMDLILVQSSKSASSLVIYRSLSWQKVADITLPESLGDKAEGVVGSSSDNTLLSYCWSPNGKCVAVAEKSSVFLYVVESLVTALGAGVGGGTTSGSSNATWTIDLLGEQTQKPSSSTTTPTNVLALHWVHVGKCHPTASVPSAAEEEREVSWRYQCHYIDQSTKFLPPSAYYSHDDSAEGRGGLADDPESSSLAHSSLPECRTPLSVLCVSTDDMEHRLYLHGRYPLLSLPRSNNHIAESKGSLPTRASSIQSPMVVASNDLAYWLTTAPGNIVSSSSNFLTLYHTPFLKRDRYALQQIATLHTSIKAHLQTIQRSVSIVADSWKTSLRPLDQKIQPLTNLLRNYGVEVNLEAKDNNANTKRALSTVMKEYIMMGHVNHSSSIANAMDQFFTGIQMNDQLIQRMERSLLASMANVESTAIRCLLRPTQALGWQIQELGGLVHFFYNISDKDVEHDNELLTANDSGNNKSNLVQELTEATEELWISVENVMTSIVTGRMLARDFCGWLRHAGSQVKARGTAPNSVQRENAKKRRITQAVLERLVTVLNKSGQRNLLEGKDEKQQIGLSETLLNLTVTKMLRAKTENGPASEGQSDCPESPSSVKGILYPTPNISPSLQRTFNATKSLFSNPLSNVPDQIKSTDIFLPRVPKNEECKIATHSRVGRNLKSSAFWDDEEEEEKEEDRTYFLPKIDHKSNHYANLSPSAGLEYSRQWFLIAQAHGATIQLFCLPLGWKHNDDDADRDVYDFEDENSEISDIPFYLTSKLILPAGGQVLKIGFYGDDGKSSLSSGVDSGTGIEGRQKIGFMYQKNSQPPCTTELFTTTYDSLSWQAVPFDPMLLSYTQVDKNCCKDIVPLLLGESRDEEDGILPAHCRTISEDSSSECCELLLCGSRGVGGVAIMSNEGVISMDILDLEDDEEEDDDDDEGSY